MVVVLYNDRQAREVRLRIDRTQQLPFCYEMRALDPRGIRPDLSAGATQTHLPQHLARIAQRNWTYDVMSQRM